MNRLHKFNPDELSDDEIKRFIKDVNKLDNELDDCKLQTIKELGETQEIEHIL